MGLPAISKVTPVTPGCWVTVKTTWAMARVWSGRTTWIGLVVKLTVATPSDAPGGTWSSVPVQEALEPGADSVGRRPRQQGAEHLGRARRGTATSRETAIRCWVGATR